MKYEHITLIAVAVISMLVLATCGSDSDDVASLREGVIYLTLPHHQ